MTLADDYKAAGWQLCDIPIGTKGPRTAGWQIKGAVSHGQGGVGLCHAFSGTCSLDIDDYPLALEWFDKNGVDLDALVAAPDAVQIVSGRVNRAKLLYRLDTPMASTSLCEYQKISEKTGKMQTFHAFELRCATKDGTSVQDVLPPTIHPDTGKPYTWAYGDDTFGHWSNLPPIPPALLAIWQKSQVVLPLEQKVAAEVKGATSAEVLKLLSGVDPDSSYADWLKVGMALHHEFKGSNNGLVAWNDWSSKGSKYQGIADLRGHWTSFKATATNPVTLGALRREEVAAPAQFEIVPQEAVEADIGEDTRPETIAKNKLEPRLVYVKSQETYYDMATNGHQWLSDRSLRHVFGPDMPIATVKDGKGGTKKVQIDPVTFLKNSKTKMIVDLVGMHPGAGRLYGEEGVRYVNSYIPMVVEEMAPHADEKEAFAFLWSRMKDQIFKDWLMQFYAHALQHPGVKIQSAPLLVSAAQGTGKNTLMKVLPEILFGSRYVRSMSGNVLGGQFNDAVSSAWWLYLEELRAGSNKSDRMHTTNKIKSWITDNTIEVHKKGLAPYDIKNRLQVVATSNFDDALQLDNNDRRWAIGEMLGPLTPRESIELYGFLLSERAPGVMRHIFRKVDISRFKPTAKAPETMAKKEMVIAGIGGWESRLIESMSAQEPPFDRDVFRLKDVSEIMMGQGLSAAALGRILRRHPFNCKLLPKFTNHRLWSWRNIAGWEAATEGQRLHHMQTGERVPGMHPGVPKAILEMSADGSVDSGGPNDDLLG